jgi:hypothetical protein
MRFLRCGLTALAAWTLATRGQEDVADEESCAAEFGDDAIAACKAKVKVAWSSNAEGRPPDANPNECVDRRPEVCTQYAESGDCESNPGWMIMMCPVTCNACHLRDPAIRCPREKLGMSLDPAYRPGELNAMFESIEERFAGQYGIQVLSRDPWVVVFDNFLTDAEARALISNVNEWEQSTDTGATNEVSLFFCAFILCAAAALLIHGACVYVGSSGRLAGSSPRGARRPTRGASGSARRTPSSSRSVPRLRT